MPRNPQDIKFLPYVNYLPTDDGLITVGINVPVQVSEALHDEEPEAWEAYLRLLDECKLRAESDMPDMYPFS